MDAMTLDQFIEIAFEMPEVNEALYYGRPSVKRGKRAMFGIKEDGETISIKLDWETHDRLLAEKPDVYFKTPHYDGWPWLLVRFEQLSEEEARQLIEWSWQDAPKPAKIRKT